MKIEITRGSGLKEYGDILREDEAFESAWSLLEYKGRNPFCSVFFITTDDGHYRVALEDYDQVTLHVTDKYKTQEHALRAMGRILDKKSRSKTE